MKNKKLTLMCSIGLILILVASMVFAACAKEEAPAAPATPDKPAAIVTTAMFYVAPPPSWSAEVQYNKFLEELEEATDGRLKSTAHWGEALGKAADQYYAIRDGVADHGHLTTALTPGLFPMVEVGMLPFAATDMINLSKAWTEIFRRGYFDPQFTEVVPLFGGPLSGYNFLFAKKKPMSMEELAGLKLRSVGGYQSKIIEALGGVPVQVSGPDWYVSITTGLLDAVTHTYSYMAEVKIYEVCKYFLEINFTTYSGMTYIWNKKSFNSLPPDIQGQIMALSSEWGVKFTQTYVDKDSEARREMEEAGIEVYTWPQEEMAKLKAASTPVWGQFIEDLEAKGYPARKMVDDFATILRDLGEDPPYQP